MTGFAGMAKVGATSGFIDIGNFQPKAINNSGVVVGNKAVGNVNHPLLWTQAGGLVDLASQIDTPLGAITSSITDINDAGDIVGIAGLPGNVSHAFVSIHNSTPVDLGDMGTLGSEAYHINNNDVVVGNLEFGGTGGAHMFLWTPTGGMVDEGQEPGFDVNTNGLNNLGEVVGLSAQAYKWTQTTGFVDLNTLIGDNGDSQAYGVNDSGIIVGQSPDDPNSSHHTPVYWTPDGVDHSLQNELGLPSNYGGYAFGINNAGQIISNTGKGAIVWSSSSGPELLVGYALFSGDADSVAYDINDNGQILGTTFNPATPNLGADAVIWNVAVPSSAPVLSDINAPTTVGKSVSFSTSATFTVPGAPDSYTAQWDWGENGNTSNGTVTNPSGSNPGTVSGSHSYANAGSYVINLSVTNANNQTSMQSFTIAVSPNSSGSFQGVQIGGLVFDNTNFSGVNLTNVQAKNTSFQNVNFIGATLSNAQLQGANLTNANFTGANLNNAQLQNTNLTGAIFTNANLHNAHFNGATLTNVTWSNTICPDNSNSDSHGSTCVGHGGGL